MTDSATPPPDPRAGHSTAKSNWFLGFGIISVLLGLLAIIFPFVAALAIEQLIGWILVFSGIAGLIHALRITHWQGHHLSLISSFFALGIGVILVLFPRSGILSLAVLVSLLFIASGILRIALAWRLRPLKRWLWLLISGIAALLLALIILSLWPEAAGWIIGALLGLDLLFSGITSILIAISARRGQKDPVVATTATEGQA